MMTVPLNDLRDANIKQIDAWVTMARGIQTSINEPNTLEATEKTKELYRQGKKVFTNFATDQSQFPCVIDRVIVELAGIVSSTQSPHTLLANSLIKTYRVFVELVFHQYRYCKLECIDPSTTTAIQESVSNIKATDQKQIANIEGKWKSGVDIRFELDCINQVAKCLKPVNWGKYLGHCSTIVQAAEGQSIIATLSALRALGQDISKDLVSGWYLDVQELRMLASLTTKESEFTTNFPSEKIQAYCDKGGKRAVCLVVAFMSIIKNPDADEATKKAAFVNLQNLFRREPFYNWAKVRKFSRVKLQEILKHPVEIKNQILRRADRLWGARSLAMQYLLKIATKKDGDKLKYSLFSDCAAQTILQRHAEFEHRSKTTANREERSQLEKRMTTLQTELNQGEERLGLLAEVVDALNPTMAGSALSPEEIQDLKEKEKELEALDDEQEHRKDELEKITLLKAEYVLLEEAAKALVTEQLESMKKVLSSTNLLQ